MEKTFLTDKTKGYLTEHKINEVLTEAANNLIQTMPANPWQCFIKTFEAHLSQAITIKSIRVSAKLDNSMARYMEMIWTLTYKTSEAELRVCLYPENLEEPKNPFLKQLKTTDSEGSAINTPHELQRLLANAFEGKEIYSYENWKVCVESLKANSPHAFETLSDSFQWFHYKILNRFEPMTMTEYLKQMIRQFPVPFEDETKSDSQFAFHFLKKTVGPQKSSKSIYFITHVSSEQEHFKLANEFFDHIRTEMNGNKSLHGKFTLDEGAFTNPYDSFADTIKLVSDIINKFSKKDSLKFVLDVDALENFDASANKFSIDGAKKPMSEEEFEDFLIKVLGEKKVQFQLIDPFPLTVPLSWHRFNKKAKEKGLTFTYATKFGAQLDVESFSKLEAEDVPGMKPDMLAKIQENKVTITETYLDNDGASSFEGLIQKVIQLKTQNKLKVNFSVSGSMNELKRYFYQLTFLLESRMIMPANDYVFARTVLNNL